MQDKRLFERIRDLDKEHQRFGTTQAHVSRGDDLQKLIASVGRYLRNLLNTRQGSVPQAPNFGMPDLTDLVQSFGGSALADVESMLVSVIEKYEPRLSDVQVQYVPDETKPFTASFTVRGNIVRDSTVVPVVYETQIASDGRIKIQDNT